MLRGSRNSGRVAVLAVFVLLLGSWQRPAPASASKLPTAREIDGILHELSNITGFRIRRQLPFALITRQEVNRYISEQIRESVKPDEIRAEEITLKKFGFVRPDFDLKQTTIDLLTEQAAAFYDFKRKKLFISDWANVNMRDAALIHELAHALADQNFPIKRFLDKGGEDSEESLARQAVVEGQASWLMLEVAARRAGKTMADPNTARQLLNSDTGEADEDYPVFDKAPLYLQKTLTFPYSEGSRFQQAVFLHDGTLAFARVFQNPPATSAQIMHPTLYFEKVGLADPSLPPPVKHAKPYVTGAMGELETEILLEQYLGENVANQLGRKIKGASYRIDETKPNHRMTFIYASEWSDEDSAKAYFDAYRRILNAKWRRFEVAGRSPGKLSGRSEDGYFLVVRDGRNILSKEGFAEPLDGLAVPAGVDNIAREVAFRAPGR